MTELTAQKIHLVMLELDRRRLAGEIPSDAPASTETMASVGRELLGDSAPSETTYRRAERMALMRARLAILAIRPEGLGARG